MMSLQEVADARLKLVDLPVRRLGFKGLGDQELQRGIAIEAPVAIEIGGIGYAVMMATPSDLEDYATGFALGEALVEEPGEIEGIDINETEGGFVVRIWLSPERRKHALERARTRVSESSCGLCGVENIEQVLRPLPKLGATLKTSRAAIERALESLPDHQPLGRATGAVHAAALCSTDGSITCVREDVGRHNALDKLIGALAREGRSAASGFILLTARCSYELVEKTVRAGCQMLVTISAPTSLAVERALSADLTLIALARSDSALIVSDGPGRLE